MAERLPGVEQAAAAAQAAARLESTGQLQEAAGQYEVAARGLMQAMQRGSLTTVQVASFRQRASQYMDRIEAIRSGSVLPSEPPPAPQPAPIIVPDVVVVAGEYSPVVRLGPEPEGGEGTQVAMPHGAVAEGSAAPLVVAGDCSCGAQAVGANTDGAQLRQRRFHILQEILSTERSYVRTLHELLDCYYKPIHRTVYAGSEATLGHECYDVELPEGASPSAADARPPALSPAEFDVLFHPSLLHIIPCQDELLRKLELAWTSHCQPGAVEAPDLSRYFEDFLPQLVLYTDYIGNYKKAAALHSSLAAGAGGTVRREKLEAFQQSVEGAGAAPLSSSLITPVQRLTRYEMLFKELLRHTTDADERARVERVLTGIAAANVEINESLRGQNRVAEAAELLGTLLHPPLPINALSRLGDGDGLQGLQRKFWAVADRTHDPQDARKIPAAIFKAGVARVQAGEVLELLQTDGGPVPYWWRVRRCCLTDRLGAESKEHEGWILAEYTRRVRPEQVAAWVDQAQGRAQTWATAAHRILSRLRDSDGSGAAGSGSGRELLRNALLQEWDPLQRRTQRRRFILVSGCLLKMADVPQQDVAQGGRASRWRRSHAARATSEDPGSEDRSLMYCDSIDLTDEGVSVVGWGMGLGLKIQVANCTANTVRPNSQKQWDLYCETVQEADSWASALQREIADGNARRRAAGVAVSARSSLTAPVQPSPFLIADDEPAQQLFPDTLVPQ